MKVGKTHLQQQILLSAAWEATLWPQSLAWQVPREALILVVTQTLFRPPSQKLSHISKASVLCQINQSLWTIRKLSAELLGKWGGK